MMQRMRELAVQAISDSNTSTDRTALNSEFTQLATEINRIASNTEWNGTKLLDGTIGGIQRWSGCLSGWGECEPNDFGHVC